MGKLWESGNYLVDLLPNLASKSITPNVITSELRNEPQTPFNPRSLESTTALRAMAIMPLMREPVMAGRGLSVAEK